MTAAAPMCGGCVLSGLVFLDFFLCHGRGVGCEVEVIKLLHLVVIESQCGVDIVKLTANGASLANLLYRLSVLVHLVELALYNAEAWRGAFQILAHIVLGEYKLLRRARLVGLIVLNYAAVAYDEYILRLGELPRLGHSVQFEPRLPVVDGRSYTESVRFWTSTSLPSIAASPQV